MERRRSRKKVGHTLTRDTQSRANHLEAHAKLGSHTRNLSTMFWDTPAAEICATVHSGQRNGKSRRRQRCNFRAKRRLRSRGKMNFVMKYVGKLEKSLRVRVFSAASDASDYLRVSLFMNTIFFSESHDARFFSSRACMHIWVI